MRRFSGTLSSVVADPAHALAAAAVPADADMALPAALPEALPVALAALQVVQPAACRRSMRIRRVAAAFENDVKDAADDVSDPENDAAVAFVPALVDIYTRCVLHYAPTAEAAAAVLERTLPPPAHAAATIYAGWVVAWTQKCGVYETRVAGDGSLRIDGGFSEFTVNLPAAVRAMLHEALVYCTATTAEGEAACKSYMLCKVPARIAALALNTHTPFARCMIDAIVPHMPNIAEEVVDNDVLRGLKQLSVEAAKPYDAYASTECAWAPDADAEEDIDMDAYASTECAWAPDADAEEDAEEDIDIDA